MQPIFYRPAQRRGLVFLGLLLLALAILGGMIWRNVHHFQTVVSYVNYSHRIQNVSVGLQQSVFDYLTESDSSVPPVELNTTLKKMQELMTDQRHLSTMTRENLQKIESMLADIGSLERPEKHQRLSAVLNAMNETLDKEGLQRENMLEDINLETQTELYVALLVFVLILLGAMLFLHFRILHPLNDLRQLLEKLTEESYTPIAIHHLDPLLLPVFDSYNHMVAHLADLEEANRLHAQSLQREVRLATQAILEQQYSLARAERLAAIGEVAAELAHEIRNPLAGIQMAFSNLRREIDDKNQTERMQMIDDELKRLTRLLNRMLDQSKHAPEAASHFDLSVLIRDLVILARYQIAQHINIDVDAPAPLLVFLPESEIRQILLNLILNAAGAMSTQGDTIAIKAHKDRLGLTIQVADNGSGFSQEMLDYGIRPFRTSHTQGTGLGLAMVQRFIRDLGGTIKLANQRTHGACVLLFLPDA
ncbi:sensor histidine kinase [Crenothrix sp.]|uniref:sensor histidine kinase n=1 Tax=Crenothrix sp. TaxID=3100433 RepID=UPI00374CFD78